MGKDLKKVVLKPSEVTEFFGIPEGTLANWRWAKKGPRYFKQPGGRGVFYLESDMMEWLTSQPFLTVDSLPEDRQ